MVLFTLDNYDVMEHDDTDTLVLHTVKKLGGPESPMLHTKSQGHRPPGSGDDFFKGFYHIWAWWPSWSCDQDHLNKL